MAINTEALSQTFSTPLKLLNGGFVTKVTLYFYAKGANETLPVTVKLVEVLNGYPTRDVLHSAMATVQAANITASSTSLIPVDFVFPDLVYIAPKKEFAIKVQSNSPDYMVWVARMGEKRIDNPALIVTEQPSAGSFFKSQNDSTWEPDQLEDLTFKIHQAVFDTSLSGQVDLVNTPLAAQLLPPNPFRIQNGSSKVRVLHPNHGLAAGMYVTFAGALSPVTAFNATWTVLKVIGPDIYVFDCGSNQTVTGAVGIATVGGAAVTGTNNASMDTYRLSIDTVKLTNTGVDYTIKQASASALEAIFNQSDNGVELDNTSRKYVMSPINETQLINGAKSGQVRVNIDSFEENLSPLLDLSTATMLAITNRINSVDTTLIDTATDGTVVFPAASVTWVATDPNNAALINYGTTSADVSKIVIGAYTSISGTASNNTAGVGVRVLDVDTTVTPTRIYFDKTLVAGTDASTVLTQYDTLVDEISPASGTGPAKYIMDPMILQQVASAFKVLFSANVALDADFDVYYRVNVESSSSPLANRPWIKVATSYKKSSNTTEFVDYDYMVDNLKAFNAIQIKIVMKSPNGAGIPRFKDLRLIALA